MNAGFSVRRRSLLWRFTRLRRRRTVLSNVFCILLWHASNCKRLMSVSVRTLCLVLAVTIYDVFILLQVSAPEATLQAMKQDSGARQSKNRGCGRGNGETLPRGCPLNLPPSAWPPLLKQPPPLPHHRRAMLLGISGGRKEPIGTGVFFPRVAATNFEPRKKSSKFAAPQEALPLFVPKVAAFTLPFTLNILPVS